MLFRTKQASDVTVVENVIRKPSSNCPVGWGRRIHRLDLYRILRLSSNECPVYDAKLSDSDVPVMLELSRMQSTPSLPLFLGLTPLQRLQSVYSTAPADWTTDHSLEGGVLLLCRDAVGVFYSPSWLDHRSLVGGWSFTPLQRCSRCILQPQLTGPQITRWRVEFYSSAEMQSVYSTTPIEWATDHLLEGGVLLLCRDAVCVFYNPYRMGHRSLVWVWSLTPLQRCSRCILQPQSNGQGFKSMLFPQVFIQSLNNPLSVTIYPYMGKVSVICI